MREIKFRAWNEKIGYIGDVLYIDFHDDELEIKCKDYDVSSSYTSRIKDFKIMQYTGLKDKNGVEIYEGYIVTLHNYNYPEQYDRWKYEVYYSEGDMRFKFRNNREFPENIITDTTTNTNFEVIGNIYETPELLKD